MDKNNISAGEMENVKMIAELTAQAAVREISGELLTEFRRENELMEQRLQGHIDAYFGRLNPAGHVVQHDRIDRLLNLFDRLGENIFATLLKNILIGLLVMGAVGYLLWLKITGGVA